MPHAYLFAQPMPTVSSLMRCCKIPYSRKEAMRLKSGKSPQPFGKASYPAGFNGHGINAYICEICGNGVWHTGHRL